MEFKLPPKFERDTRWLYVKAGIEYGPFTAPEILRAMDAHSIDGQTLLCDLQSGKRYTLSEVKPFAEYQGIVAREDELRKVDKEFEASSRSMTSKNRPLILGLAIGVPAVLGGLIAFILWPNPQEAADAPPEMAMPVVTDPTFAKGNAQKTEGFDMGQGDIVARSAPPEPGELDDYLKQKLMNENQLAKAGDVDLAKRKIVKGPDPLDKSKGRKKGPKSGVQAVGAAAAGAEENVMDFSGSGEDESGASMASSKSLAEKRLSKTVRECAKNVFKQTGGGDGSIVTATARVEPDGRIRSLKLQVEPQGPVADIKMCISSELPNLEVPPYTGDPQPIYATIQISGN